MQHLKKAIHLNTSLPSFGWNGGWGNILWGLIELDTLVQTFEMVGCWRKAPASMLQIWSLYIRNHTHTSPPPEPQIPPDWFSIEYNAAGKYWDFWKILKSEYYISTGIQKYLKILVFFKLNIPEPGKYHVRFFCTPPVLACIKRLLPLWVLRPNAPQAGLCKG